MAVLTHNFEGNVKSPYSRNVCTSAVELKILQPIDPKVVPLGNSFYIKGVSRFQDGLIACNVSREKNLLFLLAKRDTFSFGRAKYPLRPQGGLFKYEVRERGGGKEMKNQRGRKRRGRAFFPKGERLLFSPFPNG